MSLPKIERPIYSCKLNSLKNPVRFTPFIVREQKILLLALQSMKDYQEKHDTDKLPKEIKLEVKNAMFQIIDNCVIDKIDIASLPQFDFTYLFLNIRAKSDENVVTLPIKMKNCPKNANGLCEKTINMKLDINNIKIKIFPEHNLEFNVSDNIRLKMKYVPINDIDNLDEKSNIENNMELTAKHIDVIYNGSEIHKTSDYKFEEVLEFLESFTTSMFDKITQFFKTMPKVIYEADIKCKDCDKTEHVEIEGIENFFV